MDGLTELDEIRERLASVPDPLGLLSGIFAHAPLGIQIYTPDGHSVLTNRAFREMFGSEPPPEYNVLKDDIARETGVLELIHRAFRGETVQVPAIWYDPRELKQVHVEVGKRLAMESTFFPLFAPDGKISYVAILFKDVTVELEAQRRATFLAEVGAVLVGSLDYRATCKEMARLSLSWFASFCTLDVVDDGQWERVASVHMDPAKQHTVDALLGKYPPTPSSPHPAARVIRSGRAELIADVDETILQAHTIDESHRGLVRELDLRSHLAVPLEAHGRVVGALSFGRTSRQLPFSAPDESLAMELGRRIASAVQSAQLYRSAQEAIRIRDEFLSVASHELKTPLTPLRLQVELLQRLNAGTGDSRQAARFDQLQRQVLRLNKLVDALLEVSRISVGKMELAIEGVDLAQLVAEIVHRSQDEAQRAGCVLNWRSPPPIHGRWDRLRIEQVVSNLISNAIKYGGRKPIDIDVDSEDGQVTLRVRDQGIGIAEEDQQRIFARFERAASSRNYGGLGLGLYIVRQIVGAHGGTVSVSSNLGEGATFTVTLPLTASGEKRT